MEKKERNREEVFRKSRKLLGKLGEGFVGIFPISRASAGFSGHR
jgi:hypothetical protein